MRRKSNQKREKYIMLASSLFVLSALTMTGFYVKERNKPQQENSVDFSKLERTPSDKADKIDKNQDDREKEPVTEANTAKAVNPIQDRYQFSGVPIVTEEEIKIYEEKPLHEDENEEETKPEHKETSAFAQILSFAEDEGLAWPIVGNILINYSMDKTVYFETLNQYKYSPALIIAATEGESIAAAADGRVIDIYQDPQVGNCITMDLGDGYELTYGQLTDITVREGDYVDNGAILGKVCAPTKYFAKEGCNVYFKMTQNKEPVNPLNRLS